MVSLSSTGISIGAVSETRETIKVTEKEKEKARNGERWTKLKKERN